MYRENHGWSRDRAMYEAIEDVKSLQQACIDTQFEGDDYDEEST